MYNTGSYLIFEHIHQNRKDVAKGLKTNTIGKNIKQLIIFLKTPRVKKLAPTMDLTGFKIPEEEADAIYLSADEIKKYCCLIYPPKHICRSTGICLFLGA